MEKIGDNCYGVQRYSEGDYGTIKAIKIENHYYVQQESDDSASSYKASLDNKVFTVYDIANRDNL